MHAARFALTLTVTASTLAASVARAAEDAAAEVVASVARTVEPDAPEIVAEALFLRDDLPPGGRDLNLSLGIAEGEPDPATGETTYTASPRLQLALALGARLGFTADVGLASDGTEIEAPGASLKLLLRSPGVERTGIAASLDLFGSTDSLDASEAGLGVGAIRALGRLALRAAVGAVTGVSSWSPHLHGGVSAALALGSRWRVLGEVVADGAGGELALGAGPTVKAALGEHAALMVGALFPIERLAGPTYTLQLTSSL
jgi:hypothetical protein